MANQAVRRLRASHLVAALAALLGSAAFGQQIPPPEQGPALVRAEAVGGDQVRMTDARDGTVLMDARGLSLFHARNDAITPTIQVNPQPTGFDVVYTFHNDAASPRPPAAMRVGIITLGQQIRYRDMCAVQRAVPVDVETYRVQSRAYPDNLYSPVAVLENDRYAVGVSFHYPLMEYKHDVVVSLRTPGNQGTGPGGRGWEVRFDVAQDARAVYPAVVAPGGSRTYVVSVRVTDVPAEWVRTLVPYRNYYRSLYGGVQYERQITPIVGMSMANSMHISADNPDGWGTPRRRPDLHGWGPWARFLTTDRRDWNSILLWNGSGLYARNRHNNFPPQFTSHWLDNPKTATATDERIGLPTVAANGQSLGLWWGRAAQYAPMWDAPTLTPLSIHNPTHVQAALRELDLAVQAGASFIGLDAFIHRYMPVWDQESWLQTMRDRAPGVRFCIEPSTCDVLHRLVPTFENGWTTGPVNIFPDDLYNITNPFYMADFLLPGHETWAALRWVRWREATGHEAPMDVILADIQRHADWGFRTVVLHEMASPPSAVAAESWLTTVPRDLQNNALSETSGENGGQRTPDAQRGEQRNGPSVRTSPKAPRNADKPILQVRPAKSNRR